MVAYRDCLEWVCARVIHLCNTRIAERAKHFTFNLMILFSKFDTGVNFTIEIRFTECFASKIAEHKFKWLLSKKMPFKLRI